MKEDKVGDRCTCVFTQMNKSHLTPHELAVETAAKVLAHTGDYEYQIQIIEDAISRALG